MTRSITALAVGLLIIGCASDPKSFRITEENKDKFLEEMKDMKGLTVAEAGQLYGYLLRTKMGEAFGQKNPSLVGKTVGDLIKEQADFETKSKTEKEQQDRLASEAKAKEEAQANELRKAINLTVFSKSFRPSDISEGRYQDYIVIKCAYENTSGKDIRAFTGRVRFTDLFGKEIYESGLTISDPIKAGSKGTWTGTIEYNQFRDADQALRNAELADMKIVWVPKEILFADGTKLGEEN